MSTFTLTMMLLFLIAATTVLAYSLTTALVYGKYISAIQRRVLDICTGVMASNDASAETKRAASNLAVLALSEGLMADVRDGAKLATVSSADNASKSNARQTQRGEALTAAVELYVVGMLLHDRRYRRNIANAIKYGMLPDDGTSVLIALEKAEAESSMRRQNRSHQRSSEITCKVESVGAALGRELSQMPLAA